MMRVASDGRRWLAATAAVAALVGLAVVPAAPSQEPPSVPAPAVLRFPNANSRQTYFTVHHIREAWETSRGAGVKVGILDHSFGFRVRPGLYDGGKNFQRDDWGASFDSASHHGFWMASTLREVAPAVEIYALGTYSSDEAAKVDAMVRAIDWAVEHGLDVLAYSAQRFSAAVRPQLDAAVDRALAHGIVTVFIHYPHPGNLLPIWLGPVSGDDERTPDVNILHYDYQVFFTERYLDWLERGEESGYRPYLSVSATAPVTAGIVGLMKSLQPELTPAEVKRILVGTSHEMTFEGNVSPHTVDAAAAVRRATRPSPLSAREPGDRVPTVVFACIIDYPQQIPQAVFLARSSRTFSGALSASPIRLYSPAGSPEPAGNLRAGLSELGVEVRSYEVPGAAAPYSLGGKPFAAARAEAETRASADLLVLLAPNTLVVAEPKELLLPAGKELGFSPVHHQNVGSWYEEVPDEWWARIFRVLGISPSALWPMETLADRRIVRPYFSSGSLVVRPERGLLAAWARSFTALVGDADVARMSADGPRNLFLHQAALAGAMVAELPRDRMLQVSYRNNCPLLFERFFGAVYPFDSLEDVAAMRYEFAFQDLPEGWQQDVKAPAHVRDWITRQLGGLGGRP
jgi:hypothetical protein